MPPAASTGRLLTLVVGLVLSWFAAPLRAEPPAWVTESDGHAIELLRQQGALWPEFTSFVGLTAFDGEVEDLRPGSIARADTMLRDAATRLRRALGTTRDPDVRQDLRLMLDRVELDRRRQARQHALLLDWIDAPSIVWEGLSVLLDEQVAPDRRRQAVERLRRYVGDWPGTRPLTVLARERFEASRRRGRLGPVRGQVERAVEAAPAYVQGLRERFERHGLLRADDPLLDRLQSQFEAWSRWQSDRVMPIARLDPRLPPALYRLALEDVGIDVPPEDLMARARVAYQEIRAAMQALAPRVARERGLDDTDYRVVIRALKRETIERAQLEAHYQSVNGQLEEIVRRERIATLPDAPLRMRLAEPAESAAQPAPHFRSPPLIGNTGERGEFVLTSQGPSTGDGEPAYDDFNHPSVAWTLSAHEARPGHELQFGTMVEQGVSLARSVYAFNSVNVEGWALYAEAEVWPHLPPDGQLIGLQHRLLRAARAMLDPMLQLGLIQPEQALRLLIDEVVESGPAAQQEVERYLFRDPGQAASYFHGYTRLLDIRTETELNLGDRFDRLAFNDFIRSQGLMPMGQLRRAVRERFVPATLAGR